MITDNQSHHSLTQYIFTSFRIRETLPTSVGFKIRGKMSSRHATSGMPDSFIFYF